MYLHAVLLCTWLWSVEGQIVDTKYGLVEGHVVRLSDGSAVNSFLGIPFARPPLGALRWQVCMLMLPMIVNLSFYVKYISRVPLPHF